MVLDKTKAFVLENYRDIFSEYSSERTFSNQHGEVGDLYLSGGTRLNIKCNRCGKIEPLRYASYLKTKGLYCHGCKSSVSQKNMSKEQVKRKTDKTKKTCLKKYGMEGAPKKGIKHTVPWSKERRKNLSELAKTRTGEKSPRWGKSLSLKSKKQMIEANSLTWAKKVLNGDLRAMGYKSGTYFSLKLDKEVYYRSSYEYTQFLLLEGCRSVVSYMVEPFAVPYISLDGNRHHYIPDVLVIWNSGKKSLVEIKPGCFMKDEVNKLKFAAANLYIKNNDIDEFVVLDFGDFTRYVLRNMDNLPMNFNSGFMSELDDFTSGLDPKEFE